MAVLLSYFYSIRLSAYLTQSKLNHKCCIFILIIVFGVSVLPLLIPRLSLVIAVSQERGFRTNYCLFLQPPLLQFLYFHTWKKKITKTTIFRLQLLESKILCLTANEGWWFRMVKHATQETLLPQTAYAKNKASCSVCSLQTRTQWRLAVRSTLTLFKPA